MKLFITIGDLDKNILYPIIGGIFKFILNIVLVKEDFSNHPLVTSIGSSLGMSLSFFLLLIYKCRTKSSNINKDKKSNNKKKQESPLQIKYEYNNLYKIIREDKFKYILISSIIDFVTTILIFKYCISIKINIWIFDILFISLFSYLILKKKIYKHHYLSIIIIIITGFSLDIILDNYNDFLNNIGENIINFVCEVLFSFGLVINRYTMEFKFCSVFEICFYQGIFGLILYILLLILSKYITFLNNFFDNFEGFETKHIFIFIIIVIFQFIYNLCIFNTLLNTSTCHILIIIVFGELSHYFINVFEDKDNSIIIVIALLFILFMILIFIEVIELNFFGLSKNTKKNITLRAKLDQQKSINDILNTEEDLDTVSCYDESRRNTIRSEIDRRGSINENIN